MNWTQGKDAALISLLGLGVSILGYMAVSIADLNGKVAVILERIENQGRQMNDHEDRIRILEKIGF